MTKCCFILHLHKKVKLILIHLNFLAINETYKRMWMYLNCRLAKSKNGLHYMYLAARNSFNDEFNDKGEVV